MAWSPVEASLGNIPAPITKQTFYQRANQNPEQRIPAFWLFAYMDGIEYARLCDFLRYMIGLCCPDRWQPERSMQLQRLTVALNLKGV